MCFYVTFILADRRGLDVFDSSPKDRLGRLEELEELIVFNFGWAEKSEIVYYFTYQLYTVGGLKNDYNVEHEFKPLKIELYMYNYGKLN